MNDFLNNFLGGADFMPHGHCYLWTPGLVWLHVLSDLLIVLAYYSIPVALFYFVRKRRDINFGWMFVCFGIFILACGTTHLLEIWNVWHSAYWLSGSIKGITAIASILTSILLFRLIPSALKVPSPLALSRLNTDLENEIQTRRQAEERVQALNLELEARVEARTRELNLANQELQRQISERLQGDLARAQLAAIVEFSSDSIIGKNLEGIITSWNAGAQKMFGYTAGEMVGQSVTRIIPVELQHQEDLILGRISRGERVEHFETQRVRKDGKRIDVSITVSPIKDAVGRVIGASKVAREITERKQMERSLRESEERLNMVLQSSGMGTFELDLLTGEAHWNKVEFELLGLQPGEAPPGPETFFQYVHPQDAGALRAAWELATQQGEFESEFRIIRKDGQERWLAGRGRILFKEEAKGIPLKFLGVNFDITERKQVAEALRESEDLFSKAFLQSPDGVIIVRASDLTVIRANETICKLWGCTPESAVGQPARRYSEWLHEEERIRFLKILEEKGECLNWEAALRMGTGKELLASFSSRKITLHGEPCILSVLRDITENRKTQLELEQLNAHLEQRVKERTAELEASNKELEAFSYSVSHDLRAPLRAVNCFAEMTLDDYSEALPQEGRRYLQTICAGAQKMGALIDDLLTFSRLNRVLMKKLHVNTKALVQSVWEELLLTRKDREMDLRMMDLPDCEGDESLLRQVWFNLLSNAIKYSQKREHAVIEVGCDLRPEGNVYFVRDNGAGFEMRHAAKLFGVFQRLHLAEDYEGTGVGLAIVQRVILRHGGRVWADAALDRGATFYFTLNGDSPHE